MNSEHFYIIIIFKEMYGIENKKEHTLHPTEIGKLVWKLSL